MDVVFDEIVEFRSVNACIYNEFTNFKFFEEFNTDVSSSITILNLNIRSLNKSFNELLVILNCLTHEFDVIVLTETWMNESSANVCMDGYEVVINKESKNQNDGVIVFVKKCFAVCSEEVSMYGDTCVKVDIAFGRERLSLLSVYRSPSSDLSLFIDDLETYLDNRPRDRVHWLVGDINCCILQDRRDDLSQRYLDVLYGEGFISCINTPTRETGFSKSCIDHIHTDCKNVNFIKSAVIKSVKTDHYFTVAQFQSNFNKIDETSKLKNKLSVLDFQAAGRLISDTDWSFVTGIDNLNKSCELFIEKLQSIIARCISSKTVKSKYTKI